MGMCPCVIACREAGSFFAALMLGRVALEPRLKGRSELHHLYLTTSFRFTTHPASAQHPKPIFDDQSYPEHVRFPCLQSVVSRSDYGERDGNDEQNRYGGRELPSFAFDLGPSIPMPTHCRLAIKSRTSMRPGYYGLIPTRMADGMMGYKSLRDMCTRCLGAPAPFAMSCHLAT